MGSVVKVALGLALVAGLVWFGMSVRLGKHTLFGHFEAIFESDETHDLVEGTKETIDPTVERVKRGVKAGMDEAARVASPAPDAAPPDAAPARKKPAKAPAAKAPGAKAPRPR